MLYPCMLCVALLMCLFVLCVACLSSCDHLCAPRSGPPCIYK